ncbi:MAG: hypothetical protein IPM66_24910 [Acidobacteriota bacterium]|nr:MAG: hypothetical protein IPM66_24910 [Acidobacteriota bacterium]
MRHHWDRRRLERDFQKDGKQYASVGVWQMQPEVAEIVARRLREMLSI